MPFTEDATYPFWSPDSRWIGFFAQNKLKKIAASGGPSRSLCEAPYSRGGSWNRDDIIVFSPANGDFALQRCAASGGGVPTAVTRIKGDYRHPVFLPDGRHFLYLAVGSLPETSGVYVSSLDGNENRRLLADASEAMFARSARGEDSGHILFVRDGNLMAQPFDAGNAKVAGEEFLVAEGINLTTNQTYAPVSISDDGVLLYASAGGGRVEQIVWYDRAGNPLSSVAAGAIRYPAISPDQKTVAFQRLSSATASDLWLRDNRGSEARFTTDVSANATPFWSPKGDRMVFASNRKGGVYNLYRKVTNGNGKEKDELLLETGNAKFPSQWSRDGRFIVYTEADAKTKQDIWVLPVEGSAARGSNEMKAFPFVHTEFNEIFGQLSPDSRWMAYTSDESGHREVYVSPFPSAESKSNISVAGGQEPRWSGDGREIFFEAADGKLMAAMVRPIVGTKTPFQVDTPHALFDAHRARNQRDVLYEYDVTPDGKRFLVHTTNAPGPASTLPLTVVVNWTAGIKK
jgi:Tol biopolymer transport system component